MSGFSRITGAAAAVVGTAVLFGWAFDVQFLKSVAPDLVTMKPNTAAGLILAGAALWLRNLPGRLPQTAATALGCAIAVLAGITLAEDLFSWNAGVDGLLFKELPDPAQGGAPGRMSIATALGLSFVGVSVLLLGVEGSLAAGAAQALAAAAAAICVTALLGYLLHVSELYKVRGFSAFALHSALALLILNAGLLAARARAGWMREFVRPTPGARSGRRVLMIVLITLPLLGWLRLEGQKAGWYGTEFGVAISIISAMVVLTLVIWGSTRAANAADRRIQRLNRVYAMLSGINAAIVRIRDRTELFREACRIAVEVGQFGTVWIGVVDREAMLVKPVAWRGPEGVERLNELRISLQEDAPDGGTIAAEAVRTKQAVVSNDMRNDPRIRRKKSAAALGIRSAALLPLLVGDGVRGVLALHSAEAGFFDEREVRLLTELAGDIAFALDHIEKVERLDFLSYRDPLTGLANRATFLDRVSQFVNTARRRGERLAVIALDIERFKHINDALGRQVGDRLLKQIADRIAGYAGNAKHLARLGGDQFAVAIPEAGSESDVARLHERRMRECFGQPYVIDGHELWLAAKAGIALYPGDGDDAAALLACAETAAERAKAAGERYLFCEPRTGERAAEKLMLESRLRQALEKNEFVLHYQPKVELDTRRIAGAEALIRWRNPELGLVPPMQFIPLMEETGLIMEAGAWALSQAVADQFNWLKQGLRAPRVAVNVSAIQLRQKDFVSTVEKALKAGATPPGIDLEITESFVMQDIEDSVQKLRAVRELGVNIAVDDFGTGHSSLAYLAKLPLDTLKIDRAFIVAMLGDPNAMTLVQTIISLAHSLKLKAVAEGVDSEDQAKLLRLLRCDEMQGYLFSRPVPFDEMTALLAQEKNR